MRPPRSLRPTLLGLAILLPAQHLAAGWSAAEILARSKEAHGGAAWDSVRTLVLTGTFFLDGDDRPVPGEIREDLPGGRYRRSHGAGPDRVCWSYDGTRFWYRSGSGAPFTVSGPLRGQVARACAFMHARGYWFPERFPAPVEYLGPVEEGGAPCHAVRLTPPGALPVECRVDARTGLVRRIAWPMPRGLWCHRFSEYRTVQGLVLPFRISCGWEEVDGQTLIQVEGYAQDAAPPPWQWQCHEREPAGAGPCP